MPLDLLQEWIAHYGYPAMFFLLAVGIVGLPVPDDTLLTLTGFLIFKGTLQPVPAYLSALAGTLAGISIRKASLDHERLFMLSRERRVLLRRDLG